MYSIGIIQVGDKYFMATDEGIKVSTDLSTWTLIATSPPEQEIIELNGKRYQVIKEI